MGEVNKLRIDTVSASLSNGCIVKVVYKNCCKYFVGIPMLDSCRIFQIEDGSDEGDIISLENLRFEQSLDKFDITVLDAEFYQMDPKGLIKDMQHEIEEGRFVL
jgi:hypothetical protein